MIEDLLNKVHNVDCIEFMKTMEDKSVDLILTDPPYDLEIDQKKYTGVYATRGSHLDAIKEIFGNRFDPLLFLEMAMRISRNGIIVWHSKNLLKRHIDFAETNNYKWSLMFWHKNNPIPAHYNHQLNDTEYCIRIYKSGAYFNNDLKYNEYLTYYIENVQQSNGHPTPKPLSIMIKQIKIFSKEFDVIFDPFIGSGTTAIACLKTNRNFIGCEISERYCDLANKRTENYLLQEKLF